MGKFLSSQSLKIQISILNNFSMKNSLELSSHQNKAQKQENQHPKSPVLTSTDKHPQNNTEKASQELLSSIYSILYNPVSLNKKKSLKSNQSQNLEPQAFKCKCKKTKCLKMYCQCFAQGKFCNGCACTDCNNLVDFQQQRAAAIDEAWERDPDLYKVPSRQNKQGCICKKTGCLKKYCECFSSGFPCGPECKCINCNNM